MGNSVHRNDSARSGLPMACDKVDAVDEIFPAEAVEFVNLSVDWKFVVIGPDEEAHRGSAGPHRFRQKAGGIEADRSPGKDRFKAGAAESFDKGCVKRVRRVQ